jgi:hypothetical protein
MEKSDYIVLYPNLDARSYSMTYAQAKRAKRRPVKPQFIFDSLEAGELLDPVDYTSAPPKGPGTKSGKPRKDHVKKEEPVDHELPPSPKRPRVHETHSKYENEHSKPPSTQPGARREKSPQPPNEAPKAWATGYAYTDADHQWFEKYVKYLLRDEPTISLSQISKRVHQKV